MADQEPDLIIDLVFIETGIREEAYEEALEAASNRYENDYLFKRRVDFMVKGAEGISGVTWPQEKRDFARGIIILTLSCEEALRGTWDVEDD